MSDDQRSEFPVTERWAYLNHANIAPLSKRARNRLQVWADDISRNGDWRIQEWFAEIQDVRRAAAQVLNAKPREVAFLKNTSEGISLVAEGFPWTAGDNVVIVEGDYPSNVYPWTHLRSKGIELRKAGCRGYRFGVGDIANVVDDRTRIVSVSHVNFSTGFRADVASIGKFCQSRGADLFVDAIQGLGVIPLDVQQMSISYLCANSHKWLVSPQGAAIFFVAEQCIEKIRPTSVGWKSVENPHEYSRIDFRLRDGADRFECGSFVVPSIVALGASVSLFNEVGLSEVHDRVKHVTDYLIRQLATIGADVVSPRGPDEWSGIVSFRLPHVDPQAAVKRCLAGDVIISSRAGRLRASPHFYNNEDDIDRLVDCLR